MKISLYPPLSIHELGQRTNQEDSLWPLRSNEEDRLFVLCDGMGGHEHGEVASQTVSQAIGEWFEARAIEPLSKPQIEDAIAYAYAQLDQKDCGELKKMGTTLTLLYIGREGAMVAHIGDSRIYHIRPSVGVLYQSRDHSLVYDLYQAGEITFEEMETFPQKNIITRAMQPGEDNRVRADIAQITDIRPDDYFYLCSDGMLEQMSNEELADIFSSAKTDEEKRRILIDATVNNMDNHTAWMVHIKDVIREQHDESLMNEEPISRFNALNIKPQQVFNPKPSDDSDDVVVVSVPKEKASWKNNKWVKLVGEWSRYVILLIIILFAVWFFLPQKNTPTQRERNFPPRENKTHDRFHQDRNATNMLSIPIQREPTEISKHSKDSNCRNLNQEIKHEPEHK